MIHFRREGERLRQGFNFWYPNDKDSIGFVLRIHNRYLRIRWSKNIHQWFISWEKIWR